MTTLASASNARPEAVSIPEAVTLGGVSYKISESPELKEFVSKVAAVEKAKLYTTINDLKQGMEDLKRMNVSAPAPATPTGPATPFDVEAYTDSLLNKVREVVREEVKPLQENVQQQQMESLTEYRTRLVTANAATCIPELVKGNTKEELDNSLRESIALRQKYNTSPGGVEGSAAPQHVKDAANAAQIASATNIVPAPTPPVAVGVAEAQRILAPRTVAPIEDAGVDISSLSHDEFSKRRGELEAKMKTLAGG